MTTEDLSLGDALLQRLAALTGQQVDCPPALGVSGSLCGAPTSIYDVFQKLGPLHCSSMLCTAKLYLPPPVSAGRKEKHNETA